MRRIVLALCAAALLVPEPALAASLRSVLFFGTTQPNGAPIARFSFHVKTKDGRELVYPARAAGLAGFMYSLKELREEFGAEALEHHGTDFRRYLDDLLASSDDLRVIHLKEELSKLSTSGQDGVAALERTLNKALPDLRQAALDQAPSDWARTARIYEMPAWAFNLQGWRAWDGRDVGAPAPLLEGFSSDDFASIKAWGFDTVWPVGIYPIGERGRLGDGSPYSIRDHAEVRPELGGNPGLRRFVERAHESGLRVILDFVPNHTSLDSRLLEEHPEFFVTREVAGDPQRPPAGCFAHHSRKLGRWIWVSKGGFDFFGRREHWSDVAQLDLSRREVQEHMAGLASDLLKDTKADGFRVDMAYQVTAAYFNRTWGLSMDGEFLSRFIAAVRQALPGAAFVAESYDLRDYLLSLGFDSVIDKSDTDKAAGQYGWYDAWMSGDMGRIRQAVRNAAFMAFQKAGGSLALFVGGHDEAAPWRQEKFSDGAPYSGLGPAWKAAALATILTPLSLIFYGSQEAGYDLPRPDDLPKAISFKHHTPVDWTAGRPDAREFFAQAFETRGRIQADLGPEPVMTPLEPAKQAEDSWAGFLLSPSDSSPRKDIRYVVIANPTDEFTTARVSRPDLGVAGEWRIHPNEAFVVPLESPRPPPAAAPGQGGGDNRAVKAAIAFGPLAAAAQAGAAFLQAHPAWLQAAGWLATAIFFVFPMTQIMRNRANLRLLKAGGKQADEGRERLAGVSKISQAAIIIGNLCNLPTFLAAGNAALIFNGTTGALTFWYILAQLGKAGLIRRAALWSAAAGILGFLAAAPWISAVPAAAAVLGMAAVAVFSQFTIPQIRKNAQALDELRGADAGRAAKALERLKGLSPTFMILGLVGNLLIFPVFLVSGHWYNILGNMISVFGTLVILGQLAKAKLLLRRSAAAAAGSVLLYLGISLALRSWL